MEQRGFGGFLSIKEANRRLNLAAFIIHFFSCQPQLSTQPCYCNNHRPKLYAATVNVFPLRHNQTPRPSLSLPVSRPTVGPASLLGFKKGLCAEWAARSSFGFPSYSSPLPFGSRHPDRKRSDPLLPSSTGVSSQSATIGLGLQRRAV